MFFSDGRRTSHQSWTLEYASVAGTSYYAEPFPFDYRYERKLQAVRITESTPWLMAVASYIAPPPTRPRTNR
ncbi:MAG TPA: hypothetical protein VNI53_08970 [Gammaproteobacteria bacterium]|nr:hypothetical protein [Gammaproteobacteria bacterium]